MEEVMIKPVYIKFIPKVIEWFVPNYCQPEPYYSESRIILKRILSGYYENSREYQSGEKIFFVERRYLYFLREAVNQAIADKFNNEKLLSEFYTYLDEEYSKHRRN